MTVMMLGMGVLFGRALALATVGAPELVTPTALPGWTEGAVLLLAGVSLAVLFRCAPRDIAWATGAVLAPWIAFQLGVADLGRDASVFLGALIAGLLSNVYSRTLNRPAVVVRLPGILILVPGVTSFLSVSALLEGETMEGVEALFRVVAASIALVVGFLVANVALPPRKAL